MFSENALLMYQQDLQLGPYFVKWQMAGPDFPLNILQNNYGGPILRWSKFPKIYRIWSSIFRLSEKQQCMW